jgi:hypothetical protein
MHNVPHAHPLTILLLERVRVAGSAESGLVVSTVYLNFRLRLPVDGRD